MEEEQKLFIPGRICLFGEHSDWASQYKKGKGYAIVSCLDIGIFACIKKCDDYFIFRNNKNIIKIKMSAKELDMFATNNSYYLYVCEVVKYMLKKYNVSGIDINITKCTLPEKKGLSSSAAICILICRAFNKLYNLDLSIEDEMNIAYICERNIGSKCGKMDQVLAYGNDATLVEFDDDKIKCDRLIIGDDFYFVVVDLKGKKNTKKILESLNNSFQNNNKDLINYLCKTNKKIVKNAVNYIKAGKVKELGKLMNDTQQLFDKIAMPLCISELKAPKLHSLLNDKDINKYIYGGKLVGSGGDGTIQFLARNKVSQKKLLEYITNNLKLDCYDFTLKKTSSSIKKAIIPLAGLGTRMYPYTKVVPKSFIPIVKDNVFKPIFLVLIEELINAGIEEIGLVINKETRTFYDKFFNTDSIDKRYDKKLKTIYSKIKFIYQVEPRGLGDAILCCEKFINNDDFLLLLGDQFYKSNTNESCTKQLLNEYNSFNRTIISVTKICPKDVSKYGIFFGNCNRENEFKVTEILEKPSINKIKLKKYDINNLYAAFGEYILNNSIIEKMKIFKNNYPNKEIPFTELLNECLNDNPTYAFIPNGKMYDVGNVSSYIETLKNYYKED